MASERVAIFGRSGVLCRRIVTYLAAEGVGIRVAVRRPECVRRCEEFTP